MHLVVQPTPQPRGRHRHWGSNGMGELPIHVACCLPNLPLSIFRLVVMDELPVHVTIIDVVVVSVDAVNITEGRVIQLLLQERITISCGRR